MPRAVGLIAVISSAFGALLMAVIGATKTIKALTSFIPEGFSNTTETSSEANASIALIAQAIDAFLIALVLVIFGAGIYRLFVRRIPAVEDDVGEDVTKIRSIGQLKNILAELVIIILFVKFLEIGLNSSEQLDWSMLVLPAGTLLLAAALKLLDLKSSH